MKEYKLTDKIISAHSLIKDGAAYPFLQWYVATIEEFGENCDIVKILQLAKYGSSLDRLEENGYIEEVKPDRKPKRGEIWSYKQCFSTQNVLIIFCGSYKSGDISFVNKLGDKWRMDFETHKEDFKFIKKGVDFSN